MSSVLVWNVATMVLGDGFASGDATTEACSGCVEGVMSLARRLWRISESRTPAWPSLLSSLKSLFLRAQVARSMWKMQWRHWHTRCPWGHAQHRPCACCRFWQKAGSAFKRLAGLDAARSCGSRAHADLLHVVLTVIAPAISARLRNVAGWQRAR